jgi:uncharacterized repeat protein (TIGR01451 family)
MSRQRTFGRGSSRRFWFSAATVAAAAVFSIMFVAASGAGLSTSPFEGSDGNMVVDTTGHTDWESFAPPVLRTLTDLPSGTSDNSFTQGTHEDDPNVVIASGSVPPNKNDLTRAYAASQTISGETFLYLAWERQPNPDGSANIDFELNQNATAGDFTKPGALTINRTEGDILITYDFGGSGTPDLGLLTWLTAGNGHSNSDCEASGAKLPCWGDRIDLNPSSNPPAESGVNGTAIDEVFAGGQLSAGSFGEAKIDLSAVPGVFTPDTCKEFGDWFVKSRSSGSSIDAELKDFIAPAPIQVSNCAAPTISTTLSETKGSIGDSVHDSATLTGATSTAGGTVTYSVYTDSACTQGKQDAGTVDVTDGAVPDSSPITFDSPGTYYWQAVYSGDHKNDPATSACTDEQLVIAPNSPTIATTLSASGGNDGAKVHDSAKLTGATADAGGTVTYSVYSDSACSTKVADGGTVTVSNGSVPNSNDVSFGKPGTYYWQASYSGDADNDPAVSPCTDEKLVIAPLIDLSVTKVGSPNPLFLGSSDITWTMVVKNNGPDTATGVEIADPLPSGTTFVSVATTQGTCTGGATISCSLGTMAPGATVTITLVTTPTAAGTVTNTVTVVGNETETNYTNNTATATVVVNVATPPPPVYCVAVGRITPKQLFVGRKVTLTIRVTKHGKAVPGVRVRIKGPKLNTTTKRSNARGVIKRQVRVMKAGILIFTPLASKSCGTKRVGVTGVFTPPVTG